MNHIFEYCLEIEKTIKRYGSSFEAFDRDVDYQRSVSYCILQIVELSTGLSSEYRNTTAGSMPWKAIRGMGNLVAHNYGNMSREIIWETVMNDIPALRTFCEQQLQEANGENGNT
ncbi:MAG: DUF86 domain-containing protein [Clostridiales bacterium]|nr:DUF86 domain-containing protein [Clostridiales bacterium]